MKKALKELGRLLLLAFIGLMVHVIAASAFYFITGDGHESGNIGMHCAFIYAIVILIADCAIRVKRLAKDGTFFGVGPDKAKGGKTGGKKLARNFLVCIYICAVVFAISFMGFYLVPSDSAFENVTIAVSVFSMLGAVLVLFLFGVAALASLADRRRKKRLAAYADALGEIYGTGSEPAEYIDRTYSLPDFCLCLIKLFGPSCAAAKYCDPQTGKLKDSADAERLLRETGSDARVLRLDSYPYFMRSIQGMRAGVNRMLSDAGSGSGISAGELAEAMSRYDDEYSVRRRVDSERFYTHDLNIISRLLRAKGFALALVSVYAEYAGEEDIDEDGYPDDEYALEEGYDKIDFLLVLPLRSAGAFGEN